MGNSGRLALVAAVAVAAACSSSGPDEPVAEPVVCTSDAPMAIDVAAPTEQEIRDTAAGTGLDRGAAAQRARMQAIAVAVRSELRDVDLGYLMLRIDDEDDGLLYVTTEPDLACERLTELLGGGADGIAVLPAERSESDLVQLRAAVQAALAPFADGQIRLGTDKESQVIVVSVPIGAAEEVQTDLEELPDDVEDLVVVVETDLIGIEGG